MKTASGSPFRILQRQLLRAAGGILAAGLLLFATGLSQAQGNDWKRLAANEPAPAFSLTDQDGRRLSLQDLRGKVLVLTFIFTECTDICPVLPQIIGRTDQFLTPVERENVRFVGISIDPRRDTPAKLTAFMRAQHLSPERWPLLTGSVAEATRAAADYGIAVKPDPRGDLLHNAVYILIDAKGNLRTEFHGLFTPTQEIANAVRNLLPSAPKRAAKSKG